MGKRPKQLVLGITGSIAAVKAPLLVRQFQDNGFRVRCILTPSAEKFVTPLSLATLSGYPVYSEMFEKDAYKMPHLTLAEQADLMVIAPLSAVVLGRCAQGLPEDPVTLTYLSTEAPVLMAPAMHDTMWKHPATQENVALLKSRHVTFVGPTTGSLADRKKAVGRMSESPQIIKAALKL